MVHAIGVVVPHTNGATLCRLNKAVASRMASAELPTLACLHAAKLHSEAENIPHHQGPVSMDQE